MLNNVSYHKPGYHLFSRTVIQLIISALCFRTECPLQVFLIMHVRQRATGIPISTQMFVRYEAEALASSPDNKDNQIQIFYYVHVHRRQDAMVNTQSNHGLYQSTSGPSLRPRLDRGLANIENQRPKAIWGS